MNLRIAVCIVLAFASFHSFAQKVTVEGFAGDSILARSGNAFAMIVRNDTLNKFYARPFPKLDMLMKTSEFEATYARFKKRQEEHKKLTSDTNWIVKTHANGRFRIAADLNDTLYFLSGGRTAQKYAVRDLLARPVVSIHLEREKCVEYVACAETKPRKFIAFIGEKISVRYSAQPTYCNRISLDSRYEATYKVLRVIDGNYRQDTIRFEVYDHYGEPNFARFPYALLFVSDYCGKLYHEKYQFFEVYPTADGRWASPGDPYRYNQSVKDRTIKASSIAFADSVSFDIEDRKPHILDQFYPHPYYRRENGRARPVIGAYAEQLLQLKKETVLKARGIF